MVKKYKIFHNFLSKKIKPFSKDNFFTYMQIKIHKTIKKKNEKISDLKPLKSPILAKLQKKKNRLQFKNKLLYLNKFTKKIFSHRQFCRK